LEFDLPQPEVSVTRRCLEAKVRLIKAVGGGWEFRNCGWILFDGIITLILGLMVWRQWPSSSLWVIGTLVGIGMILTGTTRLMLSVASRGLQHSTAG
jgi:uncharacterized membrane protein HdeD (DUF308 family)